MKKIVILLIALFSISITGSAQFSKRDLKEIEKDAKKEAKRYEKEGWRTLPGALPLQRQLEEAYKLQRTRENGEQAYILKEGNSIGQNYDAAKMQAIQMAKLNIATVLESEIAGLVSNTVSNNQLEMEEAASITKTVNESKSMIAQHLGRVMTVVELYQTLPNKNVKVMVQLAYSNQQARKVAKKVIYEELEKESGELKDKLNNMVDW